MKAGSIVECIDNSKFSKYVKLNTPYTVQTVIRKNELVSKSQTELAVAGEDGIYLVEVRLPDVIIGDMIFENVLPMKNFRELLPSINKEVEEIMNRELIKA